MQKPATTFKTFSQVTKNIKRKRRSGIIAALLACAFAFVLAGATPSPAPQSAPPLATILALHLHAVEALHLHPSRTVVQQGSLDGLGLHGTFSAWRDGVNERYDETLGIRSERTLRLNNVEYIQNANGDVRTLRGLIARRQITEDFIDSGEFTRRPQLVTLVGGATLYDGRKVWQLSVAPPGGEPYGISIDATSGLIDEKAYADGDGVSTMDYYDYRVTGGTLYAASEVDSNGDHAYDVTSKTQQVIVGQPIDPSVFAPFKNVTVDAAAPVTVPLLDDGGHLFVRVSAGDQPLLMLVDTGAQGLFLDPRCATRLHLHTEGTMEVNGMRRTGGHGVAALDAIELGGARLPVNVVSVVDLNNVTYHAETVDGVLGYPLFAAAEIRIDPDKLTMTIAKPGALPQLGSALPLDTDRELPEATARVSNVEGRFLIDSGNSQDLLMFHDFVTAHPQSVFYPMGRHFATNSGVGGATAAIVAVAPELDLGPYRLFNRYTHVMLTQTGAFADRNDAGNIGMGTLRNFVFTFDVANRALFLEKTAKFDDGRFRKIEENTTDMPL